MDSASGTHSFRITNRNPAPLTLWIEPWGEDYTMRPGEVLEVVAEDLSEAFYFHFVYSEDGIQAYAESCGEVRVYQNGTALQCGHGRSARK